MRDHWDSFFQLGNDWVGVVFSLNDVNGLNFMDDLLRMFPFIDWRRWSFLVDSEEWRGLGDLDVRFWGLKRVGWVAGIAS